MAKWARGHISRTIPSSLFQRVAEFVRLRRAHRPARGLAAQLADLPRAPSFGSFYAAGLILELLPLFVDHLVIEALVLFGLSLLEEGA
jgi:hypothetical protein